MAAGEIKVKVSVSNEGAFAYVQAVDKIVKKHQEFFSRVMDEDDLELIEQIMEKLKSEMSSEVQR